VKFSELEGGQYKAHSFRIGGATALSLAGYSDEEIQNDTQIHLEKDILYCRLFLEFLSTHPFQFGQFWRTLNESLTYQG
jgi:hypothetical protein